MKKGVLKEQKQQMTKHNLKLREVKLLVVPNRFTDFCGSDDVGNL